MIALDYALLGLEEHVIMAALDGLEQTFWVSDVFGDLPIEYEQVLNGRLIALKPGVLQGLLGCGSAVGIGLEHLEEQILCKAGDLIDVGGDKREIAFSIKLDLFLHIVSIKEVHACN